jgi:hypothetical protein
MLLTQSSTHELTGLTADGFEFRAALTQDAEPQRVVNAALPPNITMMLDSLDTKGSGTSSLSTTSMLPVQSHMSIVSKASMRMQVAGQEQPMTTETTIEIDMDPLQK